ncbi:MAG: hypothetical protein E4G91_01625 [Candidatus Zixiibacteriota bacterium]|nr:MAG: hypothetical protein E4G91_01625 [candidate division Zixibacteria bacterium]
MNRLIEGTDFVKENEKDELHFIYRINPLRFLEEVRKIRADIKTENVDSMLIADGQPVANKPDSRSAESADTLPHSDSEADDSVDSNDEDNDFDLDSSALIDFFKDQLVEKDRQIERKDSQITSLSKALEQSQGINIELNRAILYLTTPKPDSRQEDGDEEVSETKYVLGHWASATG